MPDRVSMLMDGYPEEASSQEQQEELLEDAARGQATWALGRLVSSLSGPRMSPRVRLLFEQDYGHDRADVSSLSYNIALIGTSEGETKALDFMMRRREPLFGQVISTYTNFRMDDSHPEVTALYALKDIAEQAMVGHQFEELARNLIIRRLPPSVAGEHLEDFVLNRLEQVQSAYRVPDLWRGFSNELMDGLGRKYPGCVLAVVLDLEFNLGIDFRSLLRRLETYSHPRVLWIVRASEDFMRMCLVRDYVKRFQPDGRRISEKVSRMAWNNAHHDMMRYARLYAFKGDE